MTGATAGPAAPVPPGRAARLLVGVLLVGAAVAVGLGVLGRVHEPSGRALATFGYGSFLEAKVVLSSVALALGVGQVLTALRMYGRLGRGPGSPRVATLHRVSGLLAVAVSLPVAFQCLWVLGFVTTTPRVLAHSLAGCLLYGVLVAKLLALRVRGVPDRAVPWLGGLLFTVLVVAWLTSSLWYLTTVAG